MGATNHKVSKEDKFSNSSVLNLSLCSINSILDDSSSSNSNKGKNLIKNDIFPIEKEILLEGKEEEIKLKYFTEDDKDNYCFGSLIQRKRSKSFNRFLIKNAPKPQIKTSNELISPLKLNSKNFGIFPNWNKKSKNILYNFQKNKIDCQSCNDGGNSYDDFFSFDSETERTTPNIEDLQNLLDCRKKMTNFRNSIDEKVSKDYESILNTDYIFIDKNEKKEHQRKKNNFWHKHIRLQQMKYSNKVLTSNLPRLSSGPKVLKRADTIDTEKTKDHGLFILGILESAANDRKGRNTVNV